MIKDISKIIIANILILKVCDRLVVITPPINLTNNNTPLDGDLAKLRENLPALQGALAIAAATVTELEVILNRLRADEADLVVTTDETVTLKNLVQEKKVKETEMEQARTALEAMQQTAADLETAIPKHERCHAGG